jgi:short-subunit dehydrogenase
MAAVTVITGASSGIGAALAHEAARSGRKLVLVARSIEGLAKVADAIVAGGHARPEIIALDLSEMGAADRLAAELAKRGLSVFELVNNAGYGLAGSVVAHSRADEVGIIDLNVRALTDLTLCFLPEIIAAKGGVLNVASVAAFQPGPFRAIYYASKSYVLAFSEALTYELRGRVRVTALCPGLVPTNFQKRSNPGTEPRLSQLRSMSAEKCAAIGWRGFEAGKRVVIPGFLNKLIAFFSPRMPRKPVLALAAYLSASRRAT